MQTAPFVVQWNHPSITFNRPRNSSNTMQDQSQCRIHPARIRRNRCTTVASAHPWCTAVRGLSFAQSTRVRVQTTARGGGEQRGHFQLVLYNGSITQSQSNSRALGLLSCSLASRRATCWRRAFQIRGLEISARDHLSLLVHISVRHINLYSRTPTAKIAWVKLASLC